MTCTRPNCPRKSCRRGLCAAHWEQGIRSGLYGRVDAAPVRAHIEQLQQLGWTMRAIAAVAALNEGTVQRLMSTPRQRVLAETAHAILAIPTHPPVTVTTAGARRRIQALIWMGWSRTAIAARCGVTASAIKPDRARARMSPALAARVAAIYDQLALTPGPSDRARRMARHHGFAPPLAWDDDTIDDPAAQPRRSYVADQAHADGSDDTAVDEVAVERVVAGRGDPRALSAAERAAVAERVLARGGTTNVISAVLRCSFATAKKLAAAA